MTETERSEWLADRYEVLRVVSEGRRARVVKALDHVHARLVALKIYPVADDRHDELLAEARLLTEMAPHRSLPVVRGDFFTTNGREYVLVMNWIDGIDLQMVLDDEGDPGLPLDEVLDDLAQVAEALDHLHQHDPPIVHGDLKPANIIRAANGQVCLVDFDVATANTEATGGTPGFVAPEVAAGEKPGPAADIYGLAATAVALLSGVPPGHHAPSFSRMRPVQQAEIARGVRRALSTDPLSRPRSASGLVGALRRSRLAVQPSGVVAFLAAEVDDASTLWHRDADAMSVSMSRLRDLRDTVIEAGGGQVVTSMNEGDRTIAVFDAASSAALAALAMHERVAAEAFPPGMQVRLRIAVAVGEAKPVDGVYTGAVVDQVVRLRGAAEPGTTITSEGTAELLLELVGQGVTIIPSGPAAHAGAPRTFTVSRNLERHADTPRQRPAPPPTQPPAARVATPPAPDDAPPATFSRVLAALAEPSTAACLAVAGFGLIFQIVLASTIAVSWIGLAAAAAGFAGAAVCFVRALRRTRIEPDLHAIRTTDVVEARDRLTAGFAALNSDDGADAGAVLAALSEEYDAFAAEQARPTGRPPTQLTRLVGGLADEAHLDALAALADALELLQSTAGASTDRLRDELDAIQQRLATADAHDDEARRRDEQRRDARQQLLDRHESSRRRARDLTFQAERCATALAEARLELATARRDDSQGDFEVVVERLQDTIHLVRDVHDEIRKMRPT